MDELLAKCLTGSKWAWDAFVDRYAGVIFSAVNRTLRGGRPVDDAETAEDIAQDVFLRLIKDDFRLLRSYDTGRASLTTWLTIVTRSMTIDHMRRKRLPAVAIEDAPPIVAAEDRPTIEDPTAAIPVDLLSGRQRLVLTLLFDRQMDVEEAAETIGVSAQTIRSTKHKAIAKLREHFGENRDVEFG